VHSRLNYSCYFGEISIIGNTYLNKYRCGCIKWSARHMRNPKNLHRSHATYFLLNTARKQLTIDSKVVGVFVFHHSSHKRETRESSQLLNERNANFLVISASLMALKFKCYLLIILYSTRSISSSKYHRSFPTQGGHHITSSGSTARLISRSFE
jgi:hypothetical protein